MTEEEKFSETEKGKESLFKWKSDSLSGTYRKKPLIKYVMDKSFSIGEQQGREKALEEVKQLFREYFSIEESEEECKRWALINILDFEALKKKEVKE